MVPPLPADAIRKRISKLEAFLGLLKEFDDAHGIAVAARMERLSYGGAHAPVDTQIEAREEVAREALNSHLHAAKNLVVDAVGCIPRLRIANVDLDIFDNVFNAEGYGATFPRAAIDQTQRAIGALRAQLEDLVDAEDEVAGWDPKTFQEVVAQLESPTMNTALRIKGTRTCPAPNWDPHGTYRVHLHAGRAVIERMTEGNVWERAPLTAPKPAVATAPTPPARVRTTKTRLFISHAHDDRPLVEAFTKLLETVFEFDHETVRCTSVRPYKLELGDDGPAVLRANLADADLVVGFLTRRSLDSDFVLMELGAAWGLGTRIVPAVVPALAFKAIPPPIGPNTQAAALGDAGDVGELLDTIEKRCGFKARGVGGRRQDDTTAFSAKASELFPRTT